MTKHYEEPEVVSFVNGILGSFVRGECVPRSGGPHRPPGRGGPGEDGGSRRGARGGAGVSMRTLGIDTSNYTTSAAVFDGRDGYNAGRLLEVRPRRAGPAAERRPVPAREAPAGAVCRAARGRLAGRPGRRGGQHPSPGGGGLLHALLPGGGGPGPRPGRRAGGALLCRLPPAGARRRRRLVGGPHGAAGRPPCWPGTLSGGTTELLYVEPEGWNVRAEKIGGTSDISAGQLIDRTGVLLGLDFRRGRPWTPWRRRAARCPNFL